MPFILSLFLAEYPISATLLFAQLALLIFPRLHVLFYNATRPKNAPPLIPYSIPYLGNGFEFGTDMMGFMKRLQKQYKLASSKISK